MALPTRHREVLLLASEGKLVVTIDMREPCLLLYPLSEWEVVQRKLEALSNINRNARTLQRLLIGHATDLELDSAGRVLLPNLLREYAELNKKMVVVGQGNKLELWADDLWRARLKDWLEEQAQDGNEFDADTFTGLSV